MPSGTCRRFDKQCLRLPFRLLLLGPRLPVFAGSRILARKSYCDDVRVKDRPGRTLPRDIHLKVRAFRPNVPVEKIALHTFTRLQVERNVPPEMEGFFNQPRHFSRCFRANHEMF